MIAPAPLIILCADKHCQAMLEELLSRPAALGIAPVQPAAVINVHPASDPGCRTRGVDFLRDFQRQFNHALLIFDYDGCGAKESPDTLVGLLEQQLADSGWGMRGRAVILEPEIEAWVWAGATHVAKSIGWKGAPESLMSQLVADGFLIKQGDKPPDPKGALLAALKLADSGGVSSTIHRYVAKHASVRSCSDPALQRLIMILQEWFPPTS